MSFSGLPRCFFHSIQTSHPFHLFSCVKVAFRANHAIKCRSCSTSTCSHCLVVPSLSHQVFGVAAKDWAPRFLEPTVVVIGWVEPYWEGGRGFRQVTECCFERVKVINHPDGGTGVTNRRWQSTTSTPQFLVVNVKKNQWGGVQIPPSPFAPSSGRGFLKLGPPGGAEPTR